MSARYERVTAEHDQPATGSAPVDAAAIGSGGAGPVADRIPAATDQFIPAGRSVRVSRLDEETP